MRLPAVAMSAAFAEGIAIGLLPAVAAGAGIFCWAALGVVGASRAGAVISAGENNPYGHARPELLARLGKAGVRVPRTDRDDTVHILTDGIRLEISCL